MARQDPYLLKGPFTHLPRGEGLRGSASGAPRSGSRDRQGKNSGAFPIASQEGSPRRRKAPRCSPTRSPDVSVPMNSFPCAALAFRRPAACAASGQRSLRRASSGRPRGKPASDALISSGAVHCCYALRGKRVPPESTPRSRRRSSGSFWYRCCGHRVEAPATISNRAKLILRARRREHPAAIREISKVTR